jgi:hypothetical protein
MRRAGGWDGPRQLPPEARIPWNQGFVLRLVLRIGRAEIDHFAWLACEQGSSVLLELPEPGHLWGRILDVGLRRDDRFLSRL